MSQNFLDSAWSIHDLFITNRLSLRQNTSFQMHLQSSSKRTIRFSNHIRISFLLNKYLKYSLKWFQDIKQPQDLFRCQTCQQSVLFEIGVSNFVNDMICQVMEVSARKITVEQIRQEQKNDRFCRHMYEFLKSDGSVVPTDTLEATSVHAAADCYSIDPTHKIIMRHDRTIGVIDESLPTELQGSQDRIYIPESLRASVLEVIHLAHRWRQKKGQNRYSNGIT